jgi:mannosyltransferase OCH1-like enzyme/tetratricopeptide (TPR) repeat protein
MHLLTWHGTFVCLPDHTGAMRHQALPAAGGGQPLEIDLPDVPGAGTVRHPELGTLQIEAAAEPGAIRLLRDGLYMCADNNTGMVVFDRPSAAAWESFLPITAQDAADLGLILGYRWIVRETRRVIPRRQIGLRDGFKLRIGPYAADLATSLSTLATRRGENGLPIAITLSHAGEDVELVVAEPRSSALVQTEMWPPRGRRLAEILTFAVHRHLTGFEPTQEDFERDVAFLQERQGAPGLEDLLERVLPSGAAQTGPAVASDSQAALAAGLAAVKAHIAAARTGQAKAALERLVAIFPNEAPLWFRLGEIHQEAGAYGQALLAFEKCVALDPRHEAAAFKMANLLANFGKPLESIALLTALVEAAPRSHEPRAFLAKRYAELDWMDLALEALAPVADELGDWKESVRRGLTSHFDGLRAQFETLSSQQAPLSPHDAVRQARLAFSLGRLDICAQLLDALPETAAARADAHILQSDLRLRREGPDEAIDYLEALDGPERLDGALIVALARLHIAASWNEEASASLTTLVRQHPRGDALGLLSMIAYAAVDRTLLRFATKTWCAAHERDTLASQWAIAEARLDGRLLPLDEIATSSAELPFPELIQFWDSVEPPNDVMQAIRSWRNYNPGIVHRLFDTSAARAFIADTCAPDVLACYDAAHHPAMQSDIFRLAFLNVRGGIYVDADELCIRDMRGIFAALSRVEFIAQHSGDAPPYVNNAFIAARPGCLIIADALQEAVHQVLKMTGEGKLPDIWQVTGPGLLTRATARFVADPANAGRVMTLSDSEYHSFSITQEMDYKTTETGNWRLHKADPVAAASRAATPRAAAPLQARTDDLMMGWASREIAPWQSKPARRADARQRFDALNEDHSWISVFQFEGGKVSVRPKTGTLQVGQETHGRTGQYLRFFESVTPYLPPDFTTTLCMGMGDTLPSSYDVPLFCFQKSSGFNPILLPDIDFLNHAFYADPHLQDHLPYHEKARGAVFAGSTSGGLITPDVARDLSLPRLRAAKFFSGSEKVDFRLPNVVQCTTPQAEAILRAQPFCQKPTLTWQEQLRRRMIISIDGNGATCSRVAIALHSNSVLLKYDSDHALYYFAGMQPWMHYVPIAQDSDVERAVDMEAADPEIFAQIAENGRRFAQSYLSAESARRYTAILLQLYEDAFSDSAAPLAPAKRVPMTPPLPPGDTSVMMVHIQSRGDRSGPLGTWLGEPGSTLAIEGFAISLGGIYPAGFTYRAIMANGALSEPAARGEYRGTRGENLPTYGLLIELEGDFARRYEVHTEASFIDGSFVGPVPAGTLCAAPSAKQMEAVRITLSERRTQ